MIAFQPSSARDSMAPSMTKNLAGIESLGRYLWTSQLYVPMPQICGGKRVVMTIVADALMLEKAPSKRHPRISAFDQPA